MTNQHTSRGSLAGHQPIPIPMGGKQISSNPPLSLAPLYTRGTTRIVRTQNTGRTRKGRQRIELGFVSG